MPGVRRILRRWGGRSISPSARTVMRMGVSGIALAAFGVVVSVGVGKGYQTQIRERLVGFVGPLQVLPVQFHYSYSGEAFDVAGWFDSLREVHPDARFEVFLYQPVIFHHGGHTEGGVLRGVLDFSEWEHFPGRWAERADSLVPPALPPLLLSAVLARRLEVRPGDSLLVFWTQPRLRVRRFWVAGIYRAALEEVEEVFALAPIEAVRWVRGEDSGAAHGISVWPPSGTDARAFRTKLQSAIPYWVSVFSADELFPQVFDWLRLLDNNIRILLVLMSIVAMVTVMVVFFVLVIDRGYTVAVWKLLGASPGFFRKVFVTAAVRILGVGLTVGTALGLALLAVQFHFRVFRLPEEVYYLPYVPVAWPWGAWGVYLAVLGVSGAAGALLASAYFRWVRPYHIVRHEG